MHHLNPQQKAATSFMFGTASVIAIPGSGKTLTKATRIGNLVRQGIPPPTGYWASPLPEMPPGP